MYTVAGVTVSLKKEEQSAAPDLVGKELATTALRQLSRLQTERVVVAAAVSCTTQRKATEEKGIMMPLDLQRQRQDTRTHVLRYEHSDGRRESDQATTLSIHHRSLIQAHDLCNTACRKA